MSDPSERSIAPEDGDESARRRTGGSLGTPEHATAGNRDSFEAARVTVQRIEKPWGHELVWARTDEYCAKVIHVRAGEVIPLQLHEEQDRSLRLIRGRLTLEIGPGANSMTSIQMSPGDAVRIRPGMLHEFRAITETELIEASTPELDDTVQLRDLGRKEARGMDGTE